MFLHIFVKNRSQIVPCVLSLCADGLKLCDVLIPFVFYLPPLVNCAPSVSALVSFPQCFQLVIDASPLAFIHSNFLHRKSVFVEDTLLRLKGIAPLFAIPIKV